jgi:hypothetical protein
MFLYMSVVVAIALAVIWAGIADERNARQAGKTPGRQVAQHGANENWSKLRHQQFAKASDTDARATINAPVYSAPDTGSGQSAA